MAHQVTGRGEAENNLFNYCSDIITGSELLFSILIHKNINSVDNMYFIATPLRIQLNTNPDLFQTVLCNRNVSKNREQDETNNEIKLI